MAEELTRELTRLAERGTPRGAERVFENARRSVSGDSPGWRGATVAIAAAAATAVVLGAAVWLMSSSDGDGPTLREPASPTSLPAVDGLDSFMLVRDPEVDPVRMSTVLGDLEFVTYISPTIRGSGGERDVLFSEIVATRHGLFATEVDDVLWWSADYETWHLIGKAPGGKLERLGDDVLVLGEGGVVVVYSWNGSGWSESQRVEIDDALDVDQFVAGPDGVLVVIDNATIRRSRGGDTFTVAERPPDSAALPTQPGTGACDLDPGLVLGPLYATADGVVLLTPAHPDDWAYTPVCEPVLWYSDGLAPAVGIEWDLVSDESPFGRGALVREVLSDGDRFLAVGSVGDAAALWESVDGFTWDMLDLDFSYVGEVATGDLGWVLAGSPRADGSRQELWFSADGLDWDGPHPRPPALTTGYIPPAMAVGSDAIFGVGWRHDGAPVIGRLIPEPATIPGTLTIAARDWEGMDGYRVLAVVWGDEELAGAALWQRIDADPWSGEDVVHPPASRADLTGDIATEGWADDDYWWEETAVLPPGSYRIELTADPVEIPPYGSHIPAIGSERGCYLLVEIGPGEETTVTVTGVPIGTGDEGCPVASR